MGPRIGPCGRTGKRSDDADRGVGGEQRGEPGRDRARLRLRRDRLSEVDLVFHPQCYDHDGHFAGSDAVRAAAFLQYANDPAFVLIWFLRGGYGSNRILGTVMPQLGEAARRKAYLGYSDVDLRARSMRGASGGRRMARWRATSAARMGTRRWRARSAGSRGGTGR
ncbi:LD-carboxypeptidase [Sphingomonas sp. MMS24-JH45]